MYKSSLMSLDAPLHLAAKLGHSYGFVNLQHEMKLQNCSHSDKLVGRKVKLPSSSQFLSYIFSRHELSGSNSAVKSIIAGPIDHLSAKKSSILKKSNF